MRYIKKDDESGEIQFRLKEEKVIQKAESAKTENRYFLDIYSFFIEEQYKNGVIGDSRHKTCDLA